MKIVKILGGLGNQMFQYALAIAIQKRHPQVVVKYDIESFNGYPLHNGFELENIFNLTLKKASKLDILKVAYPYFNYRLWQVGNRVLPKRKHMCVEDKKMSYDSDLLDDSSTMWYDGYWQTEKYFKSARSAILKEFSFPDFTEDLNIELSKILMNSKCTSVHIRRGDYISHPLFKNICTVGYYKSAIEYVRNNAVIDNLIIFSNDIKWCEETFCESITGLKNIYVSWNSGEKSFRDMQLMSLCQNNIVANSSFSWWGAWLNQHDNKIVVCPSIWMNKGYAPNIIPEDWITI